MTKELVKSENGHKIIKHAKHEATHSLLLAPRIKMGFTAPCLVILFLSLAAADNTSPNTINVTPQSSKDQTTVNVELKPSESTSKAVSANKPPKVEKFGKNDDNDVAPDGDLAMDELLLFESLLADDADAFVESSKKNSEISKKIIKSSNINKDSNDPLKPRETTGSVTIRRQGDVNPSFDPKETSTELIDSNQETSNEPPLRFGQRSRKPKPKVEDEAPVLKLTQGGYDRPFKQHRSRSRYASRPDSSEQSEKIQEPERNSNRQQAARHVVPQIAYTSPRQPPYNVFGPGVVLNSAFETPPRNVLTMNPNVPTTVQSGFLNTPPTGFTDYPTSPYQGQFPGNDAGVYPNYGRDPTNVALYQTSQDNPFQDARILFQGGSRGQTQPVLVDPTRNAAPQFQPNPFSTFTNFDNFEDNSRPNYESYFRGPTVNPQFQVPPNFYATNPNPNEPQPFSNPPISYLSNPLNPGDRFTTHFLRYPVRTDSRNQQSLNDQQPESDASQEDKKTDVNSPDTIPTNNDRQSTVPFGSRISNQNEPDVFIRYPTNEAGYAIEENLPPRNGSEEEKIDSQSTSSEERNYPNADPYRNALNTLRTNQRRNNSFEYPPQFFRDVPIDFGYQGPQNQISVQHPNRNIGVTRFQNVDFRAPFDPVFLPGNNYLLLNNNRRSNQASDITPSCAKQNNASICFEDKEYPKNDILHSLNTNSFLANRLSGPDVPLDSTTFVEQNTSRSDQTSTENYACSVDTKLGSPLRAKNLAGAWKIIVSLPGRFSQPVRLEVCKSLGDACSYANSQMKTTCVQKFTLQRLLTWSPESGIYSDVFKFPIACSCQILEKSEA